MPSDAPATFRPMRPPTALLVAGTAAAVTSGAWTTSATAAVRVAALTVAPQTASPALHTVHMSARFETPVPMSIDLALPGGTRVGWLALPRRSASVDVRWHGLLDGRRVADGRYVVRLHVRGRI